MQIPIHFSFSLLLSTVSGEDTQDRTDRILLTPWVKFLWESFRNILELLKNNSLMERIYTDVAKRGASMHVHVHVHTTVHVHVVIYLHVHVHTYSYIHVSTCTYIVYM